MVFVDYLIFGTYMAAVLAVGFYFYKSNEDKDDYFVGGRSIKPSHIGLSVVATDVGGGFSIGLGGLGYVMGLSGSWLLFTGLVGAWLSAVFIIPRIKSLDIKHNMLTYPDFLRKSYSRKVALTAAWISCIGYMGFTGGQILAGAKLFSATIVDKTILGMTPLQFSLVFIGVIIIVYTVAGGLKAVIYTDTIQWIILLGGLILFAIPFTLIKVGGIDGLKNSLPHEFFTLTNVEPVTIINWFITIIPIWLIAMTLYQRIYACRTVAEAKKAWYIAGVFEYPVMAFLGTFLGMCSRILFPEVDSELGLPLLIQSVLPAGITGIVVAAYFSAIMSTADSCLIASSGNLVNDIGHNILKDRNPVRISQIATLGVGVVALLLALYFKNVLDAILYAYSFMVSGLFIPTLGAFFWKKKSSAGAMVSMISGGSVTLTMIVLNRDYWMGLDPTFFGIVISLVTFVVFSLLLPDSESHHSESEAV